MDQINCAIFSHGVFKSNLIQINQHLPKQECDKPINKYLIYGGGKPFKIIVKDDVWIIIECDYI